MQYVPVISRHVRCAKCKQLFKTEDDKSVIHICESCKEKKQE